MTKKKSKAYVVVVDGAYWVDEEAVAAGEVVELTKAQAEKLIGRGIVEPKGN